MQGGIVWLVLMIPFDVEKINEWKNDWNLWGICGGWGNWVAELKIRLWRLVKGTKGCS